jgi:hypothetical protein
MKPGRDWYMSHGWQNNRVGPYRVLRRLRGVATAQEVGKVYAAVEQSTGRPALLVHPIHTEQWHPKSEWELAHLLAVPPLEEP